MSSGVRKTVAPSGVNAGENYNINEHLYASVVVGRGGGVVGKRRRVRKDGGRGAELELALGWKVIWLVLIGLLIRILLSIVV